MTYATRKLKYLATVKPSNVDKKSVEGEQAVHLCNYTDVYYNPLITSELEFMDATATQDQIRQFQVEPGDILITKDSETADDIGVPAFIDEPMDRVLCGYHLSLIRPDPSRVIPKFLYWCMASTLVRSQEEVAASGVTRFGLRADAVAAIEVPVHSLPGQRAIADYLNAETALIDALTDKKQHVAALLEERFEASVFHLISGGLVKGPRKDSGLDWLGEIPTSWSVQRVSANFDVTLGKMVNPEASAGVEQYPYLRNTNVQWDRLDLDQLDSMHFDALDRRRCELRPGDLLVCEGGEVGRAAIWKGEVEPCFFQKAVHRVRPRHLGSTRFLMYCLRAAAGRDVFAVEGNQSTIVHLTREQLRAHRFPYPSPPEQEEVVATLDAERDRMRLLVGQLKDQIRLLAERRQALITRAVSGDFSRTGAVA